MITPSTIVLPLNVPQPVYTFTVNNLYSSGVYSASPPESNISQVVTQLKTASIYINDVGRFQYGDTFTVNGRKAQATYDTYVNQSPAILQVMQLPNVTNLAVEPVDNEEEEQSQLVITWTPNESYFTQIEVNINGAGWGLLGGFANGVSKVTWDTSEPAVDFRAKFMNAEGNQSPDYDSVSFGVPVVTTDSINNFGGTGITAHGTILSQGGSVLTAYGFVYQGYNTNTGSPPAPTLDDNVITVDTSGFTGSYSNSSDFSSELFGGNNYILFAAYATNAEGTSYGAAIFSSALFICLRAGTLITLSDGTFKKIEDVSYNDSLLVWNFDEGKLDDAKPVWMVKPFIANEQVAVKFSDGSELITVSDGKGHRIFNRDQMMFTHMVGADTPIGTNTITENGDIIQVVSKEIIKEKAAFYNIITNTHINVFANGILTSTSLNNIYPIKDMKFVKDGRKPKSREEFGEIPDDMFTGIRLAEQPESYPDLKNKIMRLASRKK